MIVLMIVEALKVAAPLFFLIWNLWQNVHEKGNPNDQYHFALPSAESKEKDIRIWYFKGYLLYLT